LKRDFPEIKLQPTIAVPALPLELFRQSGVRLIVSIECVSSPVHFSSADIESEAFQKLWNQLRMA
jgi:hypothetical protein